MDSSFTVPLEQVLQLGALEVRDILYGRLERRENQTRLVDVPAEQCIVVVAVGREELSDLDLFIHDAAGGLLVSDRRETEDGHAGLGICATQNSRRLGIRVVASQGEGAFRVILARTSPSAYRRLVEATRSVLGPADRRQSERAYRWAERMARRGYFADEEPERIASQTERVRVPIGLGGPGCRSFGVFAEWGEARADVRLLDEWGQTLAIAESDGRDSFVQACSSRAAEWTLRIEVAGESLGEFEVWNLRGDPARSAGRPGLWWGRRPSDQGQRREERASERWRHSLAANGVGSPLETWLIRLGGQRLVSRTITVARRGCFALLGVSDQVGRGMTLTLLPEQGGRAIQELHSDSSRGLALYCSDTPRSRLRVQISAKGRDASYRFSLRPLRDELAERLLQIREPRVLYILADALREGWILSEAPRSLSPATPLLFNLTSGVGERLCERLVWIAEETSAPRPNEETLLTSGHVRSAVSCSGSAPALVPATLRERTTSGWLLRFISGQMPPR